MRYAIYFAADADAPLMQLGNTWLGRDPFTGSRLQQPSIPGLDPARFEDLTTSPRRYGFHGTLKAPFSLAKDATEDALIAACTGFAKTVSPFDLKGLSVNQLGKFLALTPTQAEPDLEAFASVCVRQFEPFRAPLSAEDLDRRRQANLTPKQDAYVEAWGYPYVFDEFRFHMTLSNKLESDEEASLLARTAETHFEAVTATTLTCRHFGLYVEPERGAAFDVHRIFELTGPQSPITALKNTLANSNEEVS
jgi:putative phosphonate metabolism protein